jgi:hypothetical protein
LSRTSRILIARWRSEFAYSQTINLELLFPDVGHQPDEFEARLIKWNTAKSNLFEFTRWLDRGNRLHCVSGVGLCGIIYHIVDKHDAGSFH